MIHFSDRPDPIFAAFVDMALIDALRFFPQHARTTPQQAEALRRQGTAQGAVDATLLDLTREFRRQCEGLDLSGVLKTLLSVHPVSTLYDLSPRTWILLDFSLRHAFCRHNFLVRQTGRYQPVGPYEIGMTHGGILFAQYFAGHAFQGLTDGLLTGAEAALTRAAMEGGRPIRIEDFKVSLHPGGDWPHPLETPAYRPGRIAEYPVGHQTRHRIVNGLPLRTDALQDDAAPLAPRRPQQEA